MVAVTGRGWARGAGAAEEEEEEEEAVWPDPGPGPDGDGGGGGAMHFDLGMQGAGGLAPIRLAVGTPARVV